MAVANPQLSNTTKAHYALLLHCHVSIFPIHYPYPTLPSALLPSHPPSLPKTPSSPLFSKALPSLSIPQVRHTESHCVSGLGREHTLQPLTMCCCWTHLRRAQTTVQPFHTHTPYLFLSPFPPSFHHPPPSPFNSTIRSLFFRSHFHCFWKSATINRLHPPFF